MNDLLVEHFPEIVDFHFTSHVEEELDEIAEGKISWTSVCEEFYVPFKKRLTEKEETVIKQVEASTISCPHCGKMMVIKFGKMGKFLACPDPESKVTLPLPEEAAKIRELEEKTKDELCPLCGKAMAVKRGRFGFFLGCTDYPKCKGIKKIWNKTGFKCPNCRSLISDVGDQISDIRNQISEIGHQVSKIQNPKSEIRSPKFDIRNPTSAPMSTPTSEIRYPISELGDIVEKKGRGRFAKKPFYACTRYPDCMFLMNKKPESEAELQIALKEWKNKPSKKEKAGKDRKKSQVE